jgi:hypothetical protein
VNSTEAREILNRELATYRIWPYDQLRAIVDAPEKSFEITGPSGAVYHVDIVAYWDARPDGPVRVICAVDDGGWRAFVPMSGSFIKAPNGAFVGEDSI